MCYAVCINVYTGRIGRSAARLAGKQHKYVLLILLLRMQKVHLEVWI